MGGELPTGTPLPSMRALAKSLHVSVITVQKAYEDLQRNGFIDTTVGRGSFVAAQNADFFREEQQRRVEEHLMQATELAQTYRIEMETLIELIKLFYKGEA